MESTVGVCRYHARGSKERLGLYPKYISYRTWYLSRQAIYRATDSVLWFQIYRDTSILPCQCRRGGIGTYSISESLRYLESTSLKHWRSILETRTQQMGEDAPSDQGDAGTPSTPSHFSQSMHSREVSRVHVTTEDETVNRTANLDELHLTERPTTSTQDDSSLLTKEQGSLSPRVTSNTASSNEAPVTPRLSPRNVQDIFKELIQSQE